MAVAVLARLLVAGNLGNDGSEADYDGTRMVTVWRQTLPTRLGFAPRGGSQADIWWSIAGWNVQRPWRSALTPDECHVRGSGVRVKTPRCRIAAEERSNNGK